MRIELCRVETIHISFLLRSVYDTLSSLGPLNTLGPDGRTPAVNLVPHTDRVQNSWYRCRHYKVVRVLADALELEMQIKQPVI